MITRKEVGIKAILLFTILLILPVLASHASLIKLTVDPANPPDGFSRVFSIDIQIERNQCIIIISYNPELKEKISEKLPDGWIVEYNTEYFNGDTYLLLYDNEGFITLTAPIGFTERCDGMMSANITIHKDLLHLFKIHIYIPLMIETFCYELHFENIN
jgi:hypothetical protein